MAESKETPKQDNEQNADPLGSSAATGYMPKSWSDRLFRMREKLAEIDERLHPNLKEHYRNQIRIIEEKFKGI